MNRTGHRTGRGVAATVFALAVGQAGAAENPDWPCQQRLVPELSAGMMWGGPPLTDDLPDWRADDAMSALVERLASRRITEEAAADFIAGFAANQPAEARAARLSAVFLGLLTRANAERREIVAGIKRYTRKQRELADAIRDARDRLETSLEIEDPTAAQMEERRTLEEDLGWRTRIHEERERSLKYVCEIPVLLDQRVFRLAREIAGRID